MSRNTDNVLKLIRAGGDLSINCENRNTDNILKLVRAMNESRFKYTLRNLDNHSTDNVLKILRVCSNSDNITLEV